MRLFFIYLGITFVLTYFISLLFVVLLLLLQFPIEATIPNLHTILLRLQLFNIPLLNFLSIQKIAYSLERSPNLNQLNN
jgi:hypothetical protein